MKSLAPARAEQQVGQAQIIKDRAELDSRTFKIAPETKTSFPDYSFNSDYLPKFSDNIINHKVALLINSSLYL